MYIAVLRRGLAVPRSEPECLQRPVCPAVGPLDFFFSEKECLKWLKGLLLSGSWARRVDSLPPSRAPRGRCPQARSGGAAILPPAGWPPGMFCPSGSLANKRPPRTPWGRHLTTAAESRAPRPKGPLSAAAQHALWPGCSLPGGSAPGRWTESPTGQGTSGPPQSGSDEPPSSRVCGVPVATPGWGRATGGRPYPAGPAPGSPAPRRLTFVAPVDAGDLDLLRGDVLLHELLALQPVPQGCLARVPVPSDHDLHCGEKAQMRQTVKAKGKLPFPERVHAWLLVHRRGQCGWRARRAG